MIFSQILALMCLEHIDMPFSVKKLKWEKITFTFITFWPLSNWCMLQHTTGFDLRGSHRSTNSEHHCETKKH